MAYPSTIFSLKHNKTNKLLFIPAQAVQILSMMEDDLVVQEAEVTTLRRDVATLRHGAELREEEHRLEVLGLWSQGEGTQGAAVRDTPLQVILQHPVLGRHVEDVLVWWRVGWAPAAAEAGSGGERGPAKAADQTGAAVPQISDESFTNWSDKRYGKLSKTF